MTILTPFKVRDVVLYYVHSDISVELSSGVKGAIVGAFNRALWRKADDMTDGARYAVWGFVLCERGAPFVELRSSDLSEAQWFALSRWVGFQGSWKPRQTFEAEARWVYNMTVYYALVQARYESEGRSPVPLDELIANHTPAPHLMHSVEAQPGSLVLDALQLGATVVERGQEPLEQRNPTKGVFRL